MTDTMPVEPVLRSAFIAELRDIEWRKSGSGKDLTFTGSAVVYNSWSEQLWTPLGMFRERILPGAFEDVLKAKPDVRLLFNHDASQVLARTKSGTLELTDEPDALRVWARLNPADPDVQRLRSKMERGDVDQMSFAFMFDEEAGAEDRWYEDEDTGEILRDVIKASELLDVSPVTYPAYTDTKAAMRSLNAAALAGKITPRTVEAPEDSAEEAEAAPAETDPAGDVRSAQAETDPAEDSTPDAAPDEDAGADALAVLKARSREKAQESRETYLRSLKELTRNETHERSRGGQATSR